MLKRLNVRSRKSKAILQGYLHVKVLCPELDFYIYYINLAHPFGWAKFAIQSRAKYLPRFFRLGRKKYRLLVLIFSLVFFRQQAVLSSIKEIDQES